MTGNPLRILMACFRYLPFAGGTETHVKEVAARLVAAGHRVTVLTADPDGKLSSHEMQHGVEIRRLRSYPRGTDWGLSPGVRAVVAERRWDIIHVQGYHTLFAPAAMAAAAWHGIPFVVTFHSGGHSSALRVSARRLQHACLAPLVRRAHGLIAVSQFEADTFSRHMGIDRDRFSVVPNGARLPPPSRRAAEKIAGQPLIVSLGRLERYKGHHRVLAAFAELLHTVPGARLRILGEGPYESELQAAVRTLGLEARVEIGAIPPSDRNGMADLLAGAALVALLSDYEAHPVAVMEALSLGVPVLTSDTSGFKELAREGLVRSVALNAGAVVASEAMRAMIAQPPAVSDLRLSDWDECTQSVLSVYLRVLGKAGPSLADRADVAAA